MAITLAAGAAFAATAPRYAGRSLTDALLDLRLRGLRIVFTSEVVTPAMTVPAEPVAATLRGALDELLAPHGLFALDGPGGTTVVLPRTASSPAPPAPADTSPAVPLARFREELVITPSRVSLLREEPAAPLGISREEILALPHLGDDFFRALTLLPGATGNDVSAQFHVRGGRRDETLILLDGQELYDAYHLHDYDGALSVVSAATLSAVELATGGFSAVHGDRMSGVLDMTTVTASGEPKVRAGIAVLNGHLGSSGTFGGERGGWLVEARRGATDLVGRLFGPEDPSYWDAFGKVDYRFDSRHSLRGNFLYADDRLEFEQTTNDGTKHFATDYASSYAWLTQETIFGESLLAQTAVAWSWVERERRGEELEIDSQFAILDRRDLEIGELRQDWHLLGGARHTASWGIAYRRFDTEIDYAGTRLFDAPLARIRHDFGTPATTLRGKFRDEHTGVYGTDRLRLNDRLSLELGLRYDHRSQLAESLWSPRLNLAYRVGSRSVARAAWGRFNQSQRPYELQIADGETAFHPAERAEHRVLGFERLLGGDQERRGAALRVEWYRRDVRNPRPRFENLFEPINTFPEIEPDRVRIAPERSRAEGIELFLRGHSTPDLAWWANYAWARTEDRLAGVWRPRQYDETHSLKLDVDYRLGPRWRANAAWRYHTGWPTTPLSLRPELDEGETVFIPRLGALNSKRLSSYHRLDLRASRAWPWRSAQVNLFFDVQNVYNRKNVAGFDFGIDEDAGTLERGAEVWAGFLPSMGIGIEF